MAVLIKGKSIAGTQKSRDHYLRGPENEYIKVLEVKGFVTQSAEEALRMIELSAKGTRCERPLYSTKINPETDRLWTPEEVFRAADLLEENLGLKGHQRVIVEHKKNGRIHYHALWNRFPPEGVPAVRMSHDYAAHQKTQRQLEKELKLKPMMAKGRDFKESEVKWAQRLGYDIFKVREQITADFKKAKSGQEFKAALEKQGIILCRGDKSQFVVILPWGQHKALSSMIHGRPTKAILRRALGDIDIGKLPTVQEGKAIVRARLPKRTAKAKARRSGKGTATRTAWKTGSASFTAHLPKPVTPKITAAASEITASENRSASPPAPNNTGSTRERLDDRNIGLWLDDLGGGDDMPSRADAAYEEEFNKWTAAIEAVVSDWRVPKAMRKANVAILRQRQKDAANGVRKRVLEEEKSLAKARRNERRRKLGLPPEPEPK